MNNLQYTILCSIENEKIYQVDKHSRKEIGVIMKRYSDTMELLNKFQETANKYKKMLEDAELIKKEKTVEEIQEEQTDMIKAISKQISQLKAEVKHNGKYATKSNKSDA